MLNLKAVGLKDSIRQSRTFFQAYFWISRYDFLNYQLSKKFIREVMDAIHQESIRHQTKIMNPKKEK